MNFSMVHTNINVLDLKKSIAFYEKALGLTEQRRITPKDGSFTIVYMGNAHSPNLLELTKLIDRKALYNLGDNEIHIAFVTDNIESAHKLHSEMGCICYENKGMGIYFIEDPDGYWMEIIPKR